jgi:hypothetical protein
VSPRWAAGLLVALGVAQMAADVAGFPVARGLAAASGASPAPKVFGSVQGHETFSARFTLRWETVSGAARSLELTPEAYARLRGPYNRRNAYGAALSYGPVLQHDPRARVMLLAVAGHALCGDAPALRELAGETEAVRSARALYQPAAEGAPVRELVVACP